MLIDQHNKIITIKLTLPNGSIVQWLDSNRIFPVSLNQLCKSFEVEGKISNYKKEFNNLETVTIPENMVLFKTYALQDSKCLFNAMHKAQEIYFFNYGVDLTTCYSTPSLRFKIFKKKFLKEPIPILTKSQDKFIRDSYQGGSTDIFKKHIFNLYYYDVNSLYPSAMKKAMPGHLIGIHTNLTSLDNLFGFCLVEVECPPHVKPVLPVKFEGKTIHPTGKWIGTYFSEELKAVQKLGYKFRIIKAYEFTKVNLFTDFVNEFYAKKQYSVGSERFIAKMLLNTLYGIFGRSQVTLESINLDVKDLPMFISTKLVKSIIFINSEKCTILCQENIKSEYITELNNKYQLNLESKFKLIQANVAIASAVTAYARIHMIQYKLSEEIAYTDTDSVFLTKPLDPKLVGPEIGMMKNEMNDILIQEAIFICPNQYAYKYIDRKGNLVIKTVFSGITRDSLTWDEILILANIAEREVQLKKRFMINLLNQ
jgi:hypothetical protein